MVFIKGDGRAEAVMHAPSSEGRTPGGGSLQGHASGPAAPPGPARGDLWLGPPAAPETGDRPVKWRDGVMITARSSEDGLC